MQKLLSTFAVAMTTFKNALAVEMEGSVLVFDSQNFADEVKNYENLLVEFYSPGW